MESVKLIECPRDAWQGLPRLIPASVKVEYLRGLIAAGFQHIDAVSFVSPKAVPQMADSEAVLAELDCKGAEIIGIVVNEKGAERADRDSWKGSDAWLPLFDLRDIPAPEPEPIARRKFCRSSTHQNNGERGWAANGRIHLDGIRQSLW